MKVFAPIVVSFLVFISCSESNEDILLKVSNKISNIESVRYDSRMRVMDDGQLLHDNTCAFAFDFKNKATLEARHQLMAEESEVIYNGKISYQTLVEERIIIQNDNNDLEQVNNPMFMTLKPLIVILPK